MGRSQHRGISDGHEHVHEPRYRDSCSKLFASKYYKSRDVYDLVYDLMACIAKIGIETITKKAHLALPRYFIKEHDDEDGAAYFKKTWTLQKSNHGRWSECHATYASSCTNTSMETTWKDKKDI